MVLVNRRERNNNNNNTLLYVVISIRTGDQTQTGWTDIRLRKRGLPPIEQKRHLAREKTEGKVPSY